MKVKCVKCGKEMEEDDDGNMTAGYYKNWFDQPITCDECMWSDPRYIAIYGDRHVVGHVQTETLYVIEKLWLDPLENEVGSSYGYKIIGYVEHEEEARLYVIKGRTFTKKDCWSLLTPTPEFQYRAVKKLTI